MRGPGEESDVVSARAWESDGSIITRQLLLGSQKGGVGGGEGLEEVTPVSFPTTAHERNSIGDHYFISPPKKSCFRALLNNI